MKAVWLVSETDMRDYNCIMGAFATKEAAEAYNAELKESDEDRDYYHRVIEQEVQ